MYKDRHSSQQAIAAAEISNAKPNFISTLHRPLAPLKDTRALPAEAPLDSAAPEQNTGTASPPSSSSRTRFEGVPDEFLAIYRHSAKAQRAFNSGRSTVAADAVRIPDSKDSRSSFAIAEQPLAETTTGSAIEPSAGASSDIGPYARVLAGLTAERDEREAPEAIWRREIIYNLSGLREQWQAATPELSNTDRRNTFRLFMSLYAAAYRTFRIQGRTMRAGEATVHVPGRLLQIEFSLAPGSYSKYMKLLKAAGLVDYKSHTITSPANWNSHLSEAEAAERGVRRGQQPLSTGSLITIRMLPGYTRPVRLRGEDFHNVPRDFKADLANGNTVKAYERGLTADYKAELKVRKARWQQAQKNEHIDIPQEWSDDVKAVSQFMLPPDSPFKTPLVVSVQKISEPNTEPSWINDLGLEDVRSLPEMSSSTVAAEINTLAIQLAQHLGDTTGSTVWHLLLWRLWQRARAGEDRTEQFLSLVHGCVNEQARGTVKHAPAALISQLKQFGLWKWLGLADDAASPQRSLTGGAKRQADITAGHQRRGVQRASPFHQ